MLKTMEKKMIFYPIERKIVLFCKIKKKGTAEQKGCISGTKRMALKDERNAFEGQKQWVVRTKRVPLRFKSIALYPYKALVLST